jgi:hypothetical protein
MLVFDILEKVQNGGDIADGWSRFFWYFGYTFSFIKRIFNPARFWKGLSKYYPTVPDLAEIQDGAKSMFTRFRACFSYLV